MASKAYVMAGPVTKTANCKSALYVAGSSLHRNSVSCAASSAWTRPPTFQGKSRSAGSSIIGWRSITAVRRGWSRCRTHRAVPVACSGEYSHGAAWDWYAPSGEHACPVLVIGTVYDTKGIASAAAIVQSRFPTTGSISCTESRCPASMARTKKSTRTSVGMSRFFVGWEKVVSTPANSWTIGMAAVPHDSRGSTWQGLINQVPCT